MQLLRKRILKKLYVDKLNAEGNWVEMPYLQSMEDLENNSELIEHFRKKSEQ